MQEESYTSKASFFDGDEIPIYDKENLQEYIFSGYDKENLQEYIFSGKE